MKENGKRFGFIHDLIKYQELTLAGLEKSEFKIHQYDNVLYKYVSVETAKTILKDGTIRFSSPKSFNDPFELHLGFLDHSIKMQERKKLLRQKIADRFNNKRELDKYVDRFSHKDFLEANIATCKKVQGQSLIFCASTKNDVTLMWSHYANKHSGICLGFKIPTFYEDFDMITLHVNYVDNINTKLNIMSGADPNRTSAMFTWLSTKSKVWNYENEVRSFIPNMDGIVELDENLGYNLKFDPQQLCEVHFGVATSEKNKKEIIDIIESKKEYNISKWGKMIINDGTFDLLSVDL